MASLAEQYPQVAATWHPERNGTLTPDQVPPKVSREVWWRCPAGHEWQERIATRTTMPKWKKGDLAACRWCMGWRVTHTYPCGHSVQITAEKAAGLAADPRPRCWDCHQAWWESTGRGELSDAAKDSAAEAAELIAAIPVQDGAPEPLVREWRWWAAKHLQGAYGAQAVQWRYKPSASDVLAMVTAQAAALIPEKADAGRAAAGSGVLTMLDQAHWAAGWLHYLTGRRPRPVDAEDLLSVAGLFTEWFEEWARQAVASAAKARATLDTARITDVLTRQVGYLARNLNGPLPAQAYRELRLPVVPPGAGRYGRLDTVIWQCGFADITVEIDSAPNPSSAAKLAFARDVGAFPLWIRFGTGNVDAPEGVAVIDLRDAIRPLAR
jgi:hypothetical protein